MRHKNRKKQTLCKVYFLEAFGITDEFCFHHRNHYAIGFQHARQFQQEEAVRR